jgi:hypothetical protein
VFAHCKLVYSINNQNERETFSIGDIKRLASAEGKAAEFSNIDLILTFLNTLHGGSPLTVIWRLDEIQNVDRGKDKKSI